VSAPVSLAHRSDVRRAAGLVRCAARCLDAACLYMTHAGRNPDWGMPAHLTHTAHLLRELADCCEAEV
jgi:hypothetical protein